MAWIASTWPSRFAPTASTFSRRPGPAYIEGRQLLIFACKPAPVQVTYLGYCSSTGLEAMDYRFSDPYLDPPDADLSCYREQTIRLPQTYWCAISRADQRLTFRRCRLCLPDTSRFSAVFEQLCKSLDGTQEACGPQILRQIPRSRLLLHSKLGSHRQTVIERFERHGVSADRLEFIGGLPWDQYIRLYHRADIALDPFPYNGGITTCDALWMGVPVVALSGRTAVGRAGRSILNNVGLSELVAHEPSQYVEIAAQLAGDLSRLEQLRTTLRERMK